MYITAGQKREDFSSLKVAANEDGSRFFLGENTSVIYDTPLNIHVDVSYNTFVVIDGENPCIIYHGQKYQRNFFSQLQMNAVNSGINATKVSQYDGYETQIGNKQDALSQAQQSAVDSGITSAKVTKYDGYESQIAGQASVDTANSIIKVKSGNDYYFVQAQKLVVPTLNMGADTQYTTTASKSIAISSDTGAEIYYTYTTDGTEPADPTTNSTHSTSSVSITLTGCLANESKTIKIKAFAVKNGQTSEIASKTVTLYRKLKTPTITASDTKFYDTRSITMGLNGNESGTAIKYATGSTAPSVYDNTYNSALSCSSDTKYWAKATKDGWVDSEVTSLNVEVGKTGVHIGYVAQETAVPTTLAGIKSALGYAIQSTAAGATKSFGAIGEDMRIVIIAYPSTLADLTDIKNQDGTSCIEDYNKTTENSYKIYYAKYPADISNTSVTLS